MLELKNIKKVYEIGKPKDKDYQVTHALKGVSVMFRDSEFVSILGPSGCGKTTLLNIVGGLDKYTSGDLIINGISTKEYKDKDWDNYRNNSVGFVFQSYNLIPHQTVLENVELALTLSGVKKAERKERAKQALIKVGLGDKINSRPNQLSGGQMQRVAIARALVNDPEIILADEPTGALDTKTSVQVMELLKEVASERLVIMVTHNPELAENYSSRIIKILDGELEGDSNPITQEELDTIAENARKKQKEEQELQQKLQNMTKKQLKEYKKEQKLLAKSQKKKVKRMSFWTALSLSFKNLLTKKARTMLVSFAGSIGIFGIALILALSSGFQAYINRTQENTLSTNPITISAKSVNFSSVVMAMFADTSTSKNISHEKDAIYVKENISKMMNEVGKTLDTNNLEKFNEYLDVHYDELKPYVNAIQYKYDLSLSYYEDNTISSFEDINQIDANSAILNMIVKYSLNYFKNETGITFIENGTNNVTLYKPEDLSGSTLEEKYPFVYENNYDSLIPIVTEIDTQGYKEFTSQEEILNLVSGIMNIDIDWTSLGGGMSSMLYSSNIFNEMLDNEELVKSQYKLLAGEYLTYDKAHANDVLLVLDKNSELDDYLLYSLGLIDDTDMNKILEGLITENKQSTSINYNDVIGKTYKVFDKTDYYKDIGGNIVDIRTLKYTDNATYQNKMQQIVENCVNVVRIVGVVRLNDNDEAGSLKEGIAYSKYFTDVMVEYHNQKMEDFATTPTGLSNIDKDVPSSIKIYINTFEAKNHVKEFIEKYNAQANKLDKITYEDNFDLIMSTVSTIINAITYVLIAFVSISLVVSSIMIGIITYISVLERTKEIGVLRSVGASKGDIKLVFTSESLIIGLIAGLLGIAIALVLTIPVNIVISHLAGIAGVAALPWAGGIILVVISMLLTFIAGLVPANIASKKDPVIALRTE